MLKKLVSLLWLSFFMMGSCFAGAPVVLTYHNVLPASQRESNKGFTVSTEELLMQIQWLKLSGWSFISLKDLQKNKLEGAPLPEKSVLMTFDDGEKATCETVYPLFKEHKIPFLVAIVSDWIKDTDSSTFCSWAQLKEMAKDPLVTFSTHTHSLHKDVLANKWGGRQPAAATRVWDPNTGLEQESDYYQRVLLDLQKSKDLINRKTGAQVTSVVWPYGWYNQKTLEAAKRAGFNTTLALNTGTTDLISYRRKLIVAGMSLSAFKNTVISEDYTQTPRTVWLDLPLEKITPENNEQALSSILNTLSKYEVTKVIFSGYAQNDYASRVIWQIKSRTAATSYLHVPAKKEALSYSEYNILPDGAFADTCNTPMLTAYKEFYRNNEVYCVPTDDVSKKKIKDLRHLSNCADLPELATELKRSRISGFSDFILPASIVQCPAPPDALIQELKKR